MVEGERERQEREWLLRTQTWLGAATGAAMRGHGLPTLLRRRLRGPTGQQRKREKSERKRREREEWEKVRENEREREREREREKKWERQMNQAHTMSCSILQLVSQRYIMFCHGSCQSWLWIIHPVTGSTAHCSLTLNDVWCGNKRTSTLSGDDSSALCNMIWMLYAPEPSKISFWHVRVQYTVE